jgi:hypothetical protein
MLPERYLGIWRRDWIERHNADTGVVTRDDGPAIWFQSPSLHVDLRIDRALQALTWANTPLPCTQIAFAGRTEVRVQASTHLIERGIDGSYVESWRRLNGDDETLRCLCFQSVQDPVEQCYLMLGANYFALGSNLRHAEGPCLPIFAWGERAKGAKDFNRWRVKESLAPWWVDQEVEIDPRLADFSALLPDVGMWRLPFSPAIDWRLAAIDCNFADRNSDGLSCE